MEVFAVGFGLSIALIAVFSTVTALLLPFAWLWMFIDSLLREEWEYPQATATSNNRLVWALLIAFLQFPAIFYFFMVFRKVKRGSVVRPAWATPQVVYATVA
ncbi:MAG: hypothetical protein Q8S43_01235 [Actinomycetota bacterium]|nr:hypothetical protein [Actinomycetota bacterium]MDP3629563.1 hypothetical protein [Actinomycetota bacterium]